MKKVFLILLTFSFLLYFPDVNAKTLTWDEFVSGNEFVCGDEVDFSTGMSYSQTIFYPNDNNMSLGYYRGLYTICVPGYSSWKVTNAVPLDSDGFGYNFYVDGVRETNYNFRLQCNKDRVNKGDTVKCSIIGKDEMLPKYVKFYLQSEYEIINIKYPENAMIAPISDFYQFTLYGGYYDRFVYMDFEVKVPETTMDKSFHISIDQIEISDIIGSPFLSPYVPNNDTDFTKTITINQMKDDGIIYIDNIELVDNTESSEIISLPSYEGLNATFDVRLSEVNDYVTYKITVKNDTKKDYKITSNNFSNTYVDYLLEIDDNSIIEGNSIEDVYLTMKYVEEPPVELFQNGKLMNNSSITLKLQNGEEIINPKTGSYFILLCLILLMGMIIFLYYKKAFKIYVFLCFTIFIVPFTIFALEKLELNVDSNIELVKKYKIHYYHKSCSSSDCVATPSSGILSLNTTEAVAGTVFSLYDYYLAICYYEDMEGNYLGNCTTNFVMPPQDINIFYAAS